WDVNDDKVLRFRLKTGTTTTNLYASSGFLQTDTWYHAAAVYDGEEMILYLNGTEVGSTEKTGQIATDPTVEVRVGGSPHSDTEKAWNGLLDDIRLYSRALSQNEIQALIAESWQSQDVGTVDEAGS